MKSCKDVVMKTVFALIVTLGLGWSVSAQQPARELREKVQAQLAQGRRVLIVPHLMSFGGIEQGVRKRLEGLDYTMSEQALMPDDRIVQWVLASAR